MFEATEAGREYVDGVEFGKKLRDLGAQLGKSKFQGQEAAMLLMCKTAWSLITGDFDGEPARDKVADLVAFVKTNAVELQDIALRAMAAGMN